MLAESDETVIVEGNHYFPPSAAVEGVLRPIEKQTYCPWKGRASYLDVVVDGQVNAGAAWCYAEPKAAAKGIRGRIAFWKGVTVES